MDAVQSIVSTENFLSNTNNKVFVKNNIDEELLIVDINDSKKYNICISPFLFINKSFNNNFQTHK